MGTDDFWDDDAAALQQREAERAGGLWMPPPSDTRIPSTGVAELRMPASSSGLPASPTSAPSMSLRQIAFAICLGVELKADDSAESIRSRIDHTKARADGYSVNELQLELSSLIDVDVEDCETRSEAAWLLWEEFDEDNEYFFDCITANFQSRFCGGAISRFTEVQQPAAAFPADLIGSDATPSADYRAIPRTICVHCQRPVSSLALLCPECGKAVRSADQPLPWPAIIISGCIAGVVWFLIDVMLR